MRDAIAEKLLAKVLNWGAEEVALERPLLQAMATFKYDEYEQYSPGMRFVESLAVWLNQFEEADRLLAYEFVRKRLVFCSAKEMDHFVSTAFRDLIRPILLERVAVEFGMNRYHVGRIASSSEYILNQRQTLFLGLSDGARIDTFRRANKELNHEQIWQTHELAPRRIDELVEKLQEHVSANCFRTIVLLDDFSASGSSYFSRKDDGSYSGKIAKFLKSLGNAEESHKNLVNDDGADVIVLIYMATEKAINHLRDSLSQVQLAGVKSIRVETVQLLPHSISILRDNGDQFGPLIDKYYDHEVHDVHMRRGGTDDARYGYASCGLPVVLHHNSPNNSIALLWSYEDRDIRGLFPRVQRHREMS